VDYHEDIKSNVQKMDRPPEFLGNVFPRVGSGDENYYKIKNNRSQTSENRLKAGMKRNENIREAELDILMKQKRDCVSRRKYERLQRNPAMEVETAQAQKIFFYSRQSGNCSKKNRNIKQQKSDQSARPDDIPIPGNLNFSRHTFSLPEL
jgi:hypothetical protein